MRSKSYLRLAREEVLPGNVEARPVGPTICWDCGGSGATTRDHLIPVSTDWRPLDIPSHPGHSPANVAWAHWSCNVDRANRVTSQALSLFQSRVRILPVEWYDGSYSDFLLAVSWAESLLSGRRPFLYYGGPLDGLAPETRRPIYQDHTGKRLSPKVGDSYMRGYSRLKKPRPGIYCHQNEGYHWWSREESQDLRLPPWTPTR
jgi:hypothetical protein